MDQQWQSLGDTSSNRHSQYGSSMASQQPRDYNRSTQHHQAPPGFTYEPYQTPTLPSHPQSIATSPISTPQVKQEFSGDGDVHMTDAADPYNRMKYPSRPTHSHRASGQYLTQEDSAAARRYSPMKALSPSSPYATSPQYSAQAPHSSFASQNHSARQSPTRTNHYPPTPSSASYYSSPSESNSYLMHTQSLCSYIIEQLLLDCPHI